MWRIALLVGFGLGCVGASAVSCPDGTLCPEGTECIPVSDGYACASDEIVCGNGRVDDGEACDDGNTRIGDGCSPDCLSAEICGNGVVDPVRLVGGTLVPAETCDDSGLVGHDGCSSTCIAEAVQIVRVAQTPRPRERTAMATDVDRRRIVMFGGRASDEIGSITGPTSDTWELGRDGWTRLPTLDAPSPRDGHAMASDGSRIVLFGGVDVDNDTWVLEGATWTRLPIPEQQRPEARFGHAMAYLPGTGIVMFGGVYKGAVTDETWVFANGAWSLLSPSRRPEARMEHSLTLDPVRNELLLVGGVSDPSTTPFRDTWSFDGTTWTRRDSTTSPIAQGAVALYDARSDRIVLYGGLDALESTNATYVWDRTGWSLGVASPFARSFHAGAIDPDTGEPVVFGGVHVFIGPCPLFGPCPPVFNSVLGYSTTGWVDRNLYANDPGRYAVAFDPWRQRVVGVASSRTFERGTSSWTVANDTLPILDGPALSIGRVGTEHRVVLFGGQDGGTKLDVLRWWNGATWTSVPATIPRPAGRRNHQMVYDAKHDRTIMFGGFVGTGEIEDGETWEWNGSRWRLIASSPAPSGRTGHTMAFDPHSGTVLLFGGGKGVLATNEMWSLDGDSWTKHDLVPMPGARRDAMLAWDETRRVLILAGGTPSSNVWEWNGTAWRFANLDLESSPQVAGCPSPTGAGVLVVGGQLQGFPTRDTRHIVATSTEEYAACRSLTDDDGDGRSGCADVDCWATCAPFCPPSSAACDPALPRCGDGVCDSPRESCGICADCTCVYCGDLRCDPAETPMSCPADC